MCVYVHVCVNGWVGGCYTFKSGDMHLCLNGELIQGHLLQLNRAVRCLRLRAARSFNYIPRRRLMTYIFWVCSSWVLVFIFAGVQSQSEASDPPLEETHMILHEPTVFPHFNYTYIYIYYIYTITNREDETCQQLCAWGLELQNPDKCSIMDTFMQNGNSILKE